MVLDLHFRDLTLSYIYTMKTGGIIMDCKGEVAGDLYRVLVMGVATIMDVLFGGADGIFTTLIVFMTMDYLTGILSATIQKRLSSKVGFRGLIKKCGVLCIISLTAIMERNLLNTTTLRNAVVFYYISNEGISILENLSKIGIPIPKKLKDILYEINEDQNTEH